MQLTRYTDYSIRVLMYVSQHPGHLVTITEIADFYAISRNHLVKVVHNLAKLGYLRTVQGKNGGMRLARPAGEIRIGDVVRRTEPNFDLVECFDRAANLCVVTPVCAAKSMLAEARASFLQVLDRYTLADTISVPWQGPSLRQESPSSGNTSR